MTDEGTYIQYVARDFSAATLKIIGQANAIIASYEEQGLVLTLRQLYYQFISRGLMPNSDRSYSQLGRTINRGRLAGQISWTAIEDRTRNLMGLRTYQDPADAVKEVRSSYRRDLWVDQPFRPEVWIKKEALAGVVEGIIAPKWDALHKPHARHNMPGHSSYCDGQVEAHVIYEDGTYRAAWRCDCCAEKHFGKIRYWYVEAEADSRAARP